MSTQKTRGVKHLQHFGIEVSPYFIGKLPEAFTIPDTLPDSYVFLYSISDANGVDPTLKCTEILK